MAGQRGKKIETFKFHIDGVGCEVPVYMQGRYRGNGTTFAAYLHSPEETLRDASIDVLETKAKEAMQRRKGLEWERFIYVTYSGSSESPQADDTTFMAKSGLRYEIVEVATLADGEKTHRFANRARYGRQAYEGLPDVGPIDQYSDEDPEMRALIPETPENMQALQSIREKFIALNSRLRELLEPKRIQATLTAISGGVPLNLMHEPEKRKTARA